MIGIYIIYIYVGYVLVPKEVRSKSHPIRVDGSSQEDEREAENQPAAHMMEDNVGGE